MKKRQNEPKGTEKRKYSRLNVVAVTSSVLKKRPQDQPYFVKNISAGGVCFIVNKQIDINTIIPLQLDSPDGGPRVEAKGKIVWRYEHSLEYNMENGEQYVIGVEFTEISDSDRKRIFKYISGYTK